ncbi:hypothetical protein ACKUV4_000045 [Acinetobacter baumannii]
MIREDVKGCILTPADEGRAKIGMLPVPGGNAIYMQQQNYSLEALAKRDAKDDPFENPIVQKKSDDQKSFESLYRGVFLIQCLIKGPIRNAQRAYGIAKRSHWGI